MKVLVCGSRLWSDWAKLKDVLDRILVKEFTLHVIEGGASGADLMGRQWAVGMKQPFTEIKADWKKHGKAAGPIRNRQMLDLGPDLVVAFHDDPGLGKGTRDCVLEARRRGIRTEVFLS